MIDFIAFDLETTGFFAGQDSIVEIGAIRFSGGQPHSMYCTLVNPNRPIPPDAQKVNGISDEMVKDAPRIEDLLSSFAEFCADLPLVAHNANFDFQFLLADFKKWQRVAPSGVVLDSLPLSRKAFPGLLNYKLGTLVEHLKISSAGFHRAQADSFYCGVLFSKIIEKLGLEAEPQCTERLVTVAQVSPLKFPIIEKSPIQLDFL